MWKRILACLLIVLSIVSFSSMGFATNVVDITKYEVLNPEKSSYSTNDKVILINGKAPSGTEVKIDVYGTTDLSKEGSFTLDKLPTEKDYILLLSETTVSGNMGLFQKQLDLLKGVNKIVIDFQVEGVEPVEKIVYVYNRTRATRETKITTILPLLK